MKKDFKFLFLVTIMCSGIQVHSQINVRDHRKDRMKWVPSPGQTRPAPVANDRGTIPAAINNFRVDPMYRPEIRFKGTNWGILINNPYQVFFCNKLVFNETSLYTAQHDTKKEFLFYADTLEIEGISDLDFSKNLSNENAFLMISCRVLNLKGGWLRINLGRNEFGKYRKFYFFTEQVLVKGQKVLHEKMRLEGGFAFDERENGRWERLAAGEPAPTAWPPGIKPIPGYKFVPTKFYPFIASIGFLPTMYETNEWFYNFFSRWVAESYQHMYDRILRNDLGFDKMTKIKDFIQVIALNRFNKLEANSQTRCTQLIEKIAPFRDKIFKYDFQFERSFYVNGNSIKLIGAVTETGIVYYLPPSFTLVNSSIVNGKMISGYRVFDEKLPNVSILDFEVILSADTKLKSLIQKQLLHYETLSNGFEEMQFNNISVSGPDVIPNMTRVTVLSNNGLNIRLAVNGASSLIFHRLFSIISSDIFLIGKWSNRNSSIIGDLKLPLSFARQFNPPIEMKAGSIKNNSMVPAILDYFIHFKEIVEQSPALQIDPGGILQNIYMGSTEWSSIPSDAVFFKLNPEQFGDYFEQIDNSDKITQELFIENHISPTAMDSTGYLLYVEVVVSYTSSGKTYQRKLQLSSANTLGSNYMLVFPKSNKDPVPINITGKAIYENAEYDIIEVKLNNAEARFDLQESNLKNKML